MANENTQSGEKPLSHIPSIAEFYKKSSGMSGTPANPSGFQVKSDVPSKVTSKENPTIKDWNSKFAEISNIKVDPLRFSQPSQLGAGSEGLFLQKYYAHPDVARLGINPANFDIDNYYNKNGSVGSDFIRMAKYIGPTTWGFTKDYLKPWRHPSDLFDASPDLEGSKNYQDNMAIMMSSKPGFAGSSVNFFANLAPTLGIATGVLIEEGALATVKFGASRIPGLGALAKPAQAKAATNMLRIPGIIERAKNAKTALSVFTKADNVAKLKMLWEGQKGLGGIKGVSLGLVKEVNPVKNILHGVEASEDLKGLAKISTTFGGFFKDMQRARFAVNEAQTEGGGAIYERIDLGRQNFAKEQQKEINRITKEMQSLVNADNEITDKPKYEALFNELTTRRQKYAAGPDEKEASEIRMVAEQNGKAVTLLNLPIIYLTNAFGFEKIIGHGAVKRSLADQFVKNYEKHLVKSTVRGAAGKASYELIKDNLGKWGKKAYLRHYMMQTPGRLLDYLSKNVPEGIQELFQEGALKGVDHYYTTKYQDPYKYHKGIMGESILVGANSQMSKEGMEVFLQGMLSGGAISTGISLMQNIASPLTTLGKKTWYGKENYEKYASELNDQANRVLTAAQKAADDPAEFLKIFDKAAGEQTNYARVGEVAEALGDEKAQRDIRNDATISYVHALSQAGRLDVLIDNLKELRELDAKDLADALGTEYNEADQAKYFDRLERSIKNVQDLGQRFEAFKERMPNKYDPSRINREKNPELYEEEVRNYNAHEEATFFAVYSSKTFEDTLDRMQGIQEKFAAIPSFSNMPGMRASKIFSVSQMQDDVQSLRTQAKINEQDGNLKVANRLTIQANKLEALANASSVFSTLLSLAGKSSLTKQEQKELENARKTWLENLENSNKEKGTEFTLDDLTSQDALDEYQAVLRDAFDDYFNHATTTSNARPFLKEELDDMFNMYRDWHELGTDNRNMARWVNMLTDPVGFNEFTNNVSKSLSKVLAKRNDILKEQKRKFMKGLIQNAFLKKLYEEHKVFVSVDDIEAFEKNDRYPELIDAKTLLPIKANDPRMPMIEEMFDNYEKVHNKVVKERPVNGMGQEQSLLENMFNTAHKNKSSRDTRSVLQLAQALNVNPNETSVLNLDELCDYVINSEFASPVEKKLAQKIKSLGANVKITIKPNHSAPVTYDDKNGVIIDLRYAAPNYKGGNYRLEYLAMKGMMMALTTDFLQDSEFADEVAEMMKAVQAAIQNDPSLLNMFDGKIPVGMVAPQMFISELMVNPKFQALLGQVKSTRDPKQSAFGEIITAIRKYIRNLFNIRNTNSSILQQATSLVGLTIEQSNYLEEPGKRRKSPVQEATVQDQENEVLNEVAAEEEETLEEVVEPEEITTPTEETPVQEPEEVLSADEINEIDNSTPEEEMPQDLHDLLYAEYRKIIGIAGIKESASGFEIFVNTNPKATAIINKWKEDKLNAPTEEAPEETPADNNAKIREELLARGWLPEDINGLTEEGLAGLHATGKTKEDAIAEYHRNAEFADADKKVADFIAKLQKHLKDSGVVKVPGGYEKDGKKLPRVSDIVRDILQKKFTNAVAANRGNVLDPIFRDFFDGKINTVEDVTKRLEQEANTVDSESGEKMMTYTPTFPSQLFNTMQGIKQYLNAKGLKIIGGIPTLFGDIAGPRAGEIDFLFYDKNGNLGIIDLKTSTRNLMDSYNDPADEYQYERGHTIQQLAYRELIRQATGEDIKDIYILPIQLFVNPDGSVKNLDTLNTGTEEKPSILIKLNTSRDIFEVTGYGRPAGSEAVTRTQEEEEALAEKEKAKQEKRIEGLKEKLAKLKGEQIAEVSSGNIKKIKELGDKIAKIVDELKLYGIAVENLVTVPEDVTEEPTTVKPEVGMIIKLNDGRIVKVKKVSKKQVTVVPLNNEDAEGEILDEAVVEDLDKMVVSSSKKKTAPVEKPETEEVMNKSKSNAETLSNDKDAQAKLASEAEKLSKAEVQNNFLDKLKNRCNNGNL